MELKPADTASPGEAAQPSAAAAGKLAHLRSCCHIPLSPTCSLALLFSNQSQLLESALRMVSGHAPVTCTTSDPARTQDLAAAVEPARLQVTHQDPAGTHTLLRSQNETCLHVRLTHVMERGYQQVAAVCETSDLYCVMEAGLLH